MARVLLAWELGANLGHIAPLRALALQLRQRGHECIFAVRDLDAAEEFIEPELGRVLQAPLRLSAIRNPLRVQVSYASLLHNTGFDDAVSLAGRLRAWRQMIEGHRCDLVLSDHSPTAVVAAAGLGVPVLQLGIGFTVPPLQTPFPVFHPNTRVSSEILAHNETAVLNTLHRACERLGLPAPASLQQLFAQAERVLLSYPELDHYHVARSEPFLGLLDMARGIAPPWPAGLGPKLFAYLRPSKDLGAVLAELQRMPALVLVRVGGVAAGKLRSYERPGMIVTDVAIDMAQAARDCDAYVNYAAHGMMVEMLLAGKPGLLLPDNVERLLVALRVEQLGAALLQPPKGEFNLRAALHRIVDDTVMNAAAQTFAARHRHADRSLIPAQVADRALALIKPQRRGASAGS